MLEEAFTFALRNGNWKYIEPYSKQPPEWFNNKDIESGLEKTDQLYNLDNDINEQNNVAEEYPEKVREMKNMLEKIKKYSSRSR